MKKSKLKIVKNCGGKKGRGCAFEWKNIDFAKQIVFKKAA